MTSAVEVGTSLQAMYDNLAAATAGEALLSPAAEALASEAVVHDILAQAEAAR